LTRHRKFARLARLVGSRPLALGHLELLWIVAYENGDDLLGDAGDVEHLAEWAGEGGVLATALVESGFVDESPEGLKVHDLWDHAPEYVQRRASREAERKKTGKTISDLRREAASKRWANVKQADATGVQATAVCNANGATPSTQHPAPSTQQKQLIHGTPEEAPASVPPAPPKEVRGRKRDPVLDALVASLAAIYAEVKSEAMPAPKGSAYGDLQAVRAALADDEELKRRWGLFVADSYWPIKNLNRFREAFTHPKYSPPKARATALRSIPEFR